MSNHNTNKNNFNITNLRREIFFKVDAEGVITYIDSSIEKILGYPESTLIGNSFYRIISNKSKEFEFSFNGEDVINIQLPLIHKNGDNVYVDINYQRQVDSSNLIEIHGTMLDITNYIYQKRKLDFFDKLLDNSKDLVYYTSMVPERKFLYLSNSLESILGYTTKEFYDDLMTIATITHPDDIEELFQKGTLDRDHSKPFITRFRHRDGHYVWLEDSANLEYDENGQIVAVHGVCRDITEKIKLREKLDFLTYHDSLTGLKNRMFYDREIKKIDTEINTSIGVIICDLDNLKLINDNYGHKSGDTLIKNAAKILLQHKKDNMFVARIGGDEFAIVLTETNDIEVKKLCQDIKNSIDKHNITNDCTVNLSIGYAFNQSSIEHVEQLLKVADKRMYLEKSNNKNKALLDL